MCKETVSDVICFGKNCNIIVGYNITLDQDPCDHVLDNNLPFGACGKRKRITFGPRKSAQREMTCAKCREKARKATQDLYKNMAERVAQMREQQKGLDEQRRARREAERYRSQTRPLPSARPEAPDPQGYGAGAESSRGHEGSEHPGPQHGQHAGAVASGYGVGTDRSDGQGGDHGYGQAPSALDENSFKAFDELLAGDTADSGRDDTGEGSSHGSGQAPSALDENSFKAFDALLADDTADSGRDDTGEGSSHGFDGRHRHRGGRRHR